jgi:hypothetical protein
MPLPMTPFAVADDALHLIDDEGVGFAETGQRTGARADIADLDPFALRVGGDDVEHRGSRDDAEARFNQCAS